MNPITSLYCNCVHLWSFTAVVQFYAWVHAPASFVHNVGKQDVVLTDKCTQFTSVLWYTGLEELVYHLQSNRSERIIQELSRMLRMFCHKEKS
ncbi:hypothetical protein PR048_001746 [Dryococelus australis]|uniref:Secreted protein n=1 Tax=Dryococelus australis TaxID=614101 RepID=A0ABQ9II66_9NEOP|nr:hypothetical protein PR048_001746 [Dryococelus australis]